VLGVHVPPDPEMDAAHHVQACERWGSGEHAHVDAAGSCTLHAQHSCRKRNRRKKGTGRDTAWDQDGLIAGTCVIATRTVQAYSG